MSEDDRYLAFLRKYYEDLSIRLACKKDDVEKVERELAKIGALLETEETYARNLCNTNR